MPSATGYSAGRVFLQVVPSYKNFMTALRKDARGPLGKAIADTFEKQLGDAGYSAGEKAGLRSGDAIRQGIKRKLEGDAFSRDITKSIDKALEALGDTSESTSRRLKTIRDEFDSGAKSANEARSELDRLGESLHRVGQNDGNVQVATNARRAAEAILGTTEVSRRYAEEERRTSREVVEGHRATERSARDSEKSERKRAKAFSEGAEGNNRAARSLNGIRNALLGVKSDSNDGANAFRFFNGALLAAVTLGPALIPVLAGVAGGLALLLPMLLGIGAGLGVAALGFSGLTGAVKALSDQQKATSKDSAAYQHSVEMAARGVADAQRAVADAHRNAAEGIVNALESQRNAENKLRDAQRDAARAQKDLTDARKEARQELEDLDNKVSQNALDERQAVIDLFNAYNANGAVQADGGSTNLEREQADIALKQAQLNLKQIREEKQRLADEKAKSDKQGVDGSDTVTSAEDRLTDALERQTEARHDLKKAAKDVDKARADGARAVADAQRNLNRAQEDYNFALQGGAETTDKVRQAMDKLSPAGQRFAKFIFGLKDGFERLRRGAQERFLPGVQDGLQRILKVYGPGFTRFVNAMSTDLGNLSRKFGKAFTSKPMQAFFDAFAPAARQFTRDFGDTILSIMTGVANILTIATPYARDFSTFIADSAASFAKWTDSEKGRQQIGDFFAYIERIAPDVKDFLKSFLGFAVALVKALAPVGESVMSFLTHALERLTKIDPATLTLIAGGIAAIIVALQSSSGIVAFITLLGIIAGSPVLVAVAAIGALAAAFYFLSRSGGETQKKFESVMETLRPTIAILKEIGGLIKDKLVDIFVNSLLPALQDIWKTIKEDLLPAFVRFKPILIPLVKFLLWIGGELLKGIIDGIKNVVVGVLKILSGLMDFLTGVFTGNWSLAWSGLKNIVSGFVQAVWGIIELFLGKIFKGAGAGLRGLRGLFADFFENKIPGAVRRGLKGFAYIVTHPLDIIKSAFTLWKKSIFDTINDLLKKLPGMLGKIGGFFGKKLGNAVIDVTDFVVNKALIGGVNRIGKFLHIGGDDGLISPIKLPDKFARGGVAGIIPGNTPGRDNHTIAVGGGEAIMRPEWTRAIGSDRIRAMNDAAIRGGKGAVQKMMGFAKGGIFWPTKNKHWTTYEGHDGIDFNGPGNGLGDPYFATHSGKVAYTGAGRGYGNKVELKTDKGPTVIFGHASKILVKAGQRVEGGQQLGNIGYSGHVRPAGPAGSHLHFGLLGEAKDRGAAAVKYLLGGVLPSGGGIGGVASKLAGLSKTALSVLKDPAEFFKKRVKNGLAKMTDGATGGVLSIAKKIPTSLIGDLVDWAKKKSIGALGVAKDFFVGASKVPGKVLSKLNPFGGRGGPGLYDNGGMLPPGLSMVMNKTSRPEPVLTTEQWASMTRQGGRGDTNYNLKAEGADPRKVVGEFVDQMNRRQRIEKRSGTLRRGR